MVECCFQVVLELESLYPEKKNPEPGYLPAQVMDHHPVIGTDHQKEV
jgi:hypothetical protein